MTRATADVIDGLVGDLRRVPRGAVARRLALGLGGGVAAAIVLMLVGLGLRHDLAVAMQTGLWWTKAGYVALFAFGGLWSVDRLSRPAGTTGAPAFVVAAAVVAICGLAVAQFLPAPIDARMPLLLGDTALRCPWLVALLGLPVFGGAAWAMRGLAPTRLRLAGGMAGLAAGAAGACVYCLHCPETGLPFVAIWYTAGIALVGLLGALLGPRLLRW